MPHAVDGGRVAAGFLTLWVFQLIDAIKDAEKALIFISGAQWTGCGAKPSGRSGLAFPLAIFASECRQSGLSARRGRRRIHAGTRRLF